MIRQLKEFWEFLLEDKFVLVIFVLLIVITLCGLDLCLFDLIHSFFCQ